MRVSAAAKFILSLVAAVLITLVEYLGDNRLSAQEIVVAIVAGLTAVGVYVVPNRNV